MATNRLTWTEADPTPAEMARIERYEVWRAAGASDFGLIARMAVEYPDNFLPAVHPLEYEDNAATAGVTYSYYVSAFDGYDRELRSNQVDLLTENAFFGTLAAVSVNGSLNRAQSSEDAVTWAAQTTANNSWNSVCWSPALSIFVAVASTGAQRVMTSPDGVTWTLQTSPASNWNSVCWSPLLGLFCAVSSFGANRIMTSPDGVNWTTRTGGFNTLAVCWSRTGDLFCAVGSSGFLTSTDGITWTPQTIPVFNTWNGVVWSEGLLLFCAVATNGTNRAMTSPDGVTWTERATPANITFFDVCWSNELLLFVAVGQKAGGSDAIGVATSTDGINWVARTSTDIFPWNAVCWAVELGLFIAVGGDSGSNVGVIMTSPDGINWTAQTPAVATNNLTGVAWAPAG